MDGEDQVDEECGEVIQLAERLFFRVFLLFAFVDEPRDGVLDWLEFEDPHDFEVVGPSVPRAKIEEEERGECSNDITVKL